MIRTFDRNRHQNRRSSLPCCRAAHGEPRRTPIHLGTSLHLATICTLLFVLLTGCREDDDRVLDPGCGDSQEPSVVSTLAQLRESYEDQDWSAYRSLLADDFHFVFALEDVVPERPSEWDLLPDLASTENMFADPLLEEIGYDFILGNAVLASQSDINDHPFPPGTMKVTASEVEMTLAKRAPDGGEITIYQAAAGQAVFFLTPDSTEMICGLPSWRIIEWRDVVENASLQDDSVRKVTADDGRRGELAFPLSIGQIKWEYRDH